MAPWKGFTFWGLTEIAAKVVNEYFTPKSAEEIKDGHKQRRRRAWLRRKRANNAERKRRGLRLEQKRQRRINRRRHKQSAHVA